MIMKDKETQNDGMLPVFPVLYELHFPRSLKLAKKITKNSHMAEDATQDSFIKAYRHRGKIQNSEHFNRWLTLSTTHSAIDNLRKNSRYLFIEDIQPLGYTLKAGEYLPVVALIERENRRELWKMVRSLTPAHSYILQQKYYLKRSYEEISQRTGISETTWRSRCHRALRKLQVRYGEQIKEMKIRDPL
jgi:RNA polymerase sigma factor (sigma-70 family)